MEHILPRSLGGTDDQENLAASYYRCNEFKGAKTHAIDPDTNQLVELFNHDVNALLLCHHISAQPHQTVCPQQS